MNNGDINDMLGRVLQNPEALGSIMKLAQGLKNNDNTAPAPQQNGQPDESEDTIPEDGENQREQNTASQLPRLFNHDENRTRLLIALKPYLGKNRREKVDSIMNMLQLMELAGSANLLPRR